MITPEQEQAVRMRQEERFLRRSSHTAARYLREIEFLPGLPKAMEPFLNTLRRIYVDHEGVAADIPCIGIYCMMVPQELIYAAGAMPVKLCSGHYTAFQIGDDRTPRDACPLVKAVAGFREMKTMPIYEDCRLMVVPAACDCKKKIADLLSRESDVHVMNLPMNRTDDTAISGSVTEYKRLIRVVEAVTGQAVTWKRLRDSIWLTGFSQREMSRFLRFKNQERALIRGTHIMAMMNAASYMPQEQWTDCLHSLNEELSERQAKEEYITKANRPRIMLTGSPIIFPNMKLPLLIEQMGGSLAADETCMGERFLYDPVVPTDMSFDGLLRALANRYIRACTCPVFSENRQRIDRVLHMVHRHKIQGVVYHVLRGCLVYDYEFPLLEKALEKEDIPVIRVESDYNEEDVEQIRIRIEAFIELIKLKDLKGKGVGNIHDR
ncbi:MAG: 2-hydroxyacyl-CoA dehydratase family protein [Lachnospiraceae bacterium]|nr:2-hydroxyacyl-CoA dehydratase family protein [Lachnospiraceae bacterium]